MNNMALLFYKCHQKKDLHIDRNKRKNIKNLEDYINNFIELSYYTNTIVTISNFILSQTPLYSGLPQVITKNKVRIFLIIQNKTKHKVQIA